MLERHSTRKLYNIMACILGKFAQGHEKRTLFLVAMRLNTNWFLWTLGNFPLRPGCRLWIRKNLEGFL